LKASRAEAASNLLHHLLFSTRALSTDKNGRATLEIYRPATLDISVTADGYAARAFYRVPIIGEQLFLELERERIVEVELIAPDGSPAVEGAGSVEVYIDSNSGFSGEQIGPNRWRLKQLPAGLVVISVGAIRGSILHNTAVPTAQIVVGHVGDCGHPSTSSRCA
jgi:hypothetical protein